MHRKKPPILKDRLFIKPSFVGQTPQVLIVTQLELGSFPFWAEPGAIFRVPGPRALPEHLPGLTALRGVLAFGLEVWRPYQGG